MNFKEYALSHQTEICLELDRVRLLLQKAGSPDKKLKIIHVAGTNGKGSVCSFVCAGLSHMGKKYGRFSSPELFCINDTITVNGKNISDEALSVLLGSLSALSGEVASELGKAPSQFEISFVASLMHFAKEGCEYAVLECGMGGLGDATNAIDDSVVSVITHIALDHTQYLGDTTEKIAVNKCGIFKKSSVVVTGAQSADVQRVIRAMAGSRRLIWADEPRSIGYENFCEIFDYKKIKNLKSSLCGVHQIYNASVAIEVLQLLGANENTIRFAVLNAVNPARMERLKDALFFDGAHNPDGVKVLVDSINRYSPKGKIIFVTGFMKDKAYSEAFSILGGLDNSNFEIYTVNVHSNPRSESSKKLCETARMLGFAAKSFDNVTEAVEEAVKNADLTVAFGSLYMYKELKR